MNQKTIILSGLALVVAGVATTATAQLLRTRGVEPVSTGTVLDPFTLVAVPVKATPVAIDGVAGDKAVGASRVSQVISARPPYVPPTRSPYVPPTK